MNIPRDLEEAVASNKNGVKKAIAGFAGKIVAMSIKLKILLAVIAIVVAGIGTLVVVKFVKQSSDQVQNTEIEIQPIVKEELSEMETPEVEKLEVEAEDPLEEVIEEVTVDIVHEYAIIPAGSMKYSATEDGQLGILEKETVALVFAHLSNGFSHVNINNGEEEYGVLTSVLQPYTDTTSVETPTETYATTIEVTDLSMILYAKQSVNVRSGPSKEYGKLGALSKNQEVTITGQASNGWYRIVFSGAEAFVSDSYLTDTMSDVVTTTIPQATSETEVTAPIVSAPIVAAPVAADSNISIGGNYSVGSEYGPYLSQAELNEVQAVVTQFVSTYITADMSDYMKVKTAHDYLCDTCSYAPSWSENQANSAWGALIYHEAQCSGYTRAFIALCDAMGIDCYYVHSTSGSHQWNVIYLTDGYYIVDVTNDDANNCYNFFLLEDLYFTSMIGETWDTSLVPASPYDYFGLSFIQRSMSMTDEVVNQYYTNRDWMVEMYFKVKEWDKIN